MGGGSGVRQPWKNGGVQYSLSKLALRCIDVGSYFSSATAIASSSHTVIPERSANTRESL